jgi:hypothetical protein
VCLCVSLRGTNRKQGKCPRAFHVSCARNNGDVQFSSGEVDELDVLPVPEGAPPGTQPEVVTIQVLKVELLCPTHNPVSSDSARGIALC